MENFRDVNSGYFNYPFQNRSTIMSSFDFIDILNTYHDGDY
jgi:hypothetical protein